MRTLLLALAFTSPVLAQEAPPDLRFEVSCPISVRDEATTGCVYVMIARSDRREPYLQIGRTGVPFFGEDVTDLSPGERAVIDADTLGSPLVSLRELPPGEYYVQAFLNLYTKFERSDGHTLWMHMDRGEGQHWNRSPGNLKSQVQRIYLDPTKGWDLHLPVTEMLPPVRVPADTRQLKRFKIRSEKLSTFWGRDMEIGATVLLPRGYHEHPEAHYPVVYKHGHFSLRSPYPHGPDDAWMQDDFPRMIAITIQHPTPYFDDSYAVNSANNGPYGDAIHDELIPAIAQRFRTIEEPWARTLTGGSTGGWEACALQVFYPKFYGGAWIFAPDPVDFSNVEGIDIYEDENAFFKIHEWRRVPIPNTRNAATGEVLLTSEQRNRFELVCGTLGRSGQQLDIWSAVFGPVGDDGYFKPLFDKRTGAINREVAEYWREHYDIHHHLRTHWSRLGPDLVGKLHFFCGRRDNFYLNVGLEKLEDFLRTTRQPYFGGTFSWGGRGGHSWNPFGSQGELLRLISLHIEASAPDGASIGDWHY